MTKPRRVILDAVRATSAHPSATLVYRQVRRQLPHVSLATVYRNLRTLATEGFIGERPDASGMRFDGNTRPHDHFTCVGCGRIFDVPVRTAARGSLATWLTGFEVLDQRIEFYGRCRRVGAGATEHPPTAKEESWHRLRSPLPDEARRTFPDAEVALVVEHPNERARTVLPAEIQVSLAADLAEE